MISRKVAVQLVVLPVFGLLALGSASPKKSGDPSPSSSTSTTEVTSAGAVLGSCLRSDSCLEDLPGGRDEWQAKGECTGGLTEKGTWRAGVGCPTNRRYFGSCLHEESVGSYRRYEYLKDGEVRDAKLAKEACEASGKWTPNPLEKTEAKPAGKPAAKPTAAATAKPAQAPKKK